jgi:ribulose-phosphate 3-epimerase
MEAVKAIKRLGIRAGMTIKPQTSPETILPVFDELHLALVMSVEPGFGGQKLMPQMLKKVEFFANYASKHGLGTEIEIDGGIYLDNAYLALDAGATIIVAGSAVFAQEDPGKAVRDFTNMFEAHKTGQSKPQ